MTPHINEYPIENKHFSDLNPMIFGYEICKSKHTFGPAIRKYYLIHYVVSGKGYFYSGGCKYIVNVGSCFVIKPNEITTYTADEKDPWHYIWIGFDGKLANKLSELKSPIIKLNSYVFKEMLNISDNTTTKEEFLTGKLFMLFSEIFSENKNDNHVEIIKNYIQSNYMKKITVSEISKIVSLDRHYLTRLFKANTGKTTKEYLIETRLSEAIRLLKNGHSVTNTCYMVGYEDIFTFSKAFKKNFGHPPSATIINEQLTTNN